jgi:membrane dipeptidase
MNAAPGAGRPILRDLAGMIDYAVDVMGIDHVGIGTDQSADSATREEWEAMFGGPGRPSRYPEITGHLGAWFGFDTRFVEGFDSIDCFPRLTDALLAKGYADADVRKILGENFLRLFANVWNF